MYFSFQNFLCLFHPLWSVAHCSWKKCFNEIFRGGWGTKLTLLTFFYRSKLCLSQHEACNTIDKFFPNFFSKLAATKAQVWISIPELEVFWGNTKKISESSSYWITKRKAVKGRNEKANGNGTKSCFGYVGKMYTDM